MNLILNTFHKQLYSEACIPKSLDVHMAPTLPAPNCSINAVT